MALGIKLVKYLARLPRSYKFHCSILPDVVVFSLCFRRFSLSCFLTLYKCMHILLTGEINPQPVKAGVGSCTQAESGVRTIGGCGLFVCGSAALLWSQCRHYRCVGKLDFFSRSVFLNNEIVVGDIVSDVRCSKLGKPEIMLPYA